MFRLIPLAAMVLASVALAGGDGGVLPPLELGAVVRPESVALGEPFTLEVRVTHDPGQRYEFKAPGELGDFDLVKLERSREDGAAASTTTLRATLQAFALGTHPVPALELEVTTPAGVQTLPAPRPTVTVASSLPPDADAQGADLADVRPPEAVPVRTWRLLYALAGLLAVGLLAWGLRRALRRPRPVAAPPAPPPEPLHVRTTAALDALARENLPSQARFKEFYFRLSEIVRGYLGERYGFEALESTTPELLAALRARSTPGLPMADVAAFAEASDFARYARAEPTVDACKAHLELAYRVVHATTAAAPPRPAP